MSGLYLRVYPNKGDGMKGLIGVIATLAMLLFVGCGGGSSDSGVETTSSKEVYSLTTDTNHAVMGPLKGATVKIYKLDDMQTPIEEVQTDELGGFSVALDSLDDNELLLVVVSGGVDIDANDDGVLDDTPVSNKGKIRAIATAADLRASSVNVTLLSEVLYNYVEQLIGQVHPDDLEEAMNAVAKKLLKDEIGGNYKDINHFNPLDNAQREKLSFDYSTLIGNDANESLSAKIYNDENATEIKTVLQNHFQDKMVLNDISLVPEKRYFKIALVEPAKSSITSDGSTIFVDYENNSSKLVDFVATDSNISFTITTDSDLNITGWDGCDKVSDDQKTCYLVEIQSDRLVIPNVVYADTEYADNVKDLTGYYVSVLDDNVSYAVSLDLDAPTEKRDFVESIKSDDIIINTSDSQKFFRKVTAVRKVDDYNYVFTTTDVAFVELYKRGSASVDRALTYNDLADDLQTINRSLKSKYGNVKLLPPTKPNDDTFVLQFGGVQSTDSLNRAIEHEDSAKFELADGVDLEGKLTFKLDADFNYNVSWHLFGPSLDSMRFVIKNDVKSELKIIATKEGLNLGKEFQVGPTLRFRIPVAASPIWVDATLTFYIGASGKIEGIVTVGGEAGVNTKIGFNYANGHVLPIGNIDPNGKFSGSTEVKFSTGAYLKALPALTVSSIAGIGVDNRLTIGAENSFVVGISTSGAECDISKGKAYGQYSISPVFTWDPWLRDFDWAKDLEEDINDQISLTSSLTWVLKEWSNPCLATPSYLEVYGDDVTESVKASEGIDKAYTYVVKNSGDEPLNWKVEKSGSLSDFVTISPTSGTLAKDENITVMVVVSKSDLSEDIDSTLRAYIKFINDVEDDRSIFEKGGETYTIAVDVVPDVVAPVLNSVSLNGESIKRINFEWNYSGTAPIDGFKLYKSDCAEDNYELFKVIAEPSTRIASWYYDEVASSFVAGRSYCFKLSSYKEDVESELSNAVTLDIPEYAKLISNIKDKDGNPLPSATVRLTTLSHSQTVEGTGDYVFENLLPGKYLITVEAEGYMPTTATVELSPGQILIYEGQFMLDDDLEGIVGTVTGKVRNAINNSEGVPDVQIDIREGGSNTTGEIIKSIYSDSNGDYAVNDLTSGTYTFTWSKPGYITDSANVVVIGNETVTKDLSISPVLSVGTMRITLRWGENPADLDSHLVKTKDGEEVYHIYYSNMYAENDSLDTDDTTSYGPETVTIDSVDPTAKYTYYVHHYSGSGSIATSGATVTVQTDSGSQTFYPPNEDGIYWKVFDIINGEIVPCTSNCMGSSVDIARSLRNGEKEDAYLFQNLPAKE